MAEIFISYTSDRRNAAKHLAGVLTRYGYSVWFDYGLLKGDDFEFQLDSQLRAAKAVIVLWCSMSVQSQWVSREASLASRLKTMLPALIEECELKLAHHTTDYVDLREWDGSPRSHTLDPLLKAVARLVGRPLHPDWEKLTEYEEDWRMFGSPTLATFALGKPIKEPAAGLQSNAIALAAQEWPSVRDSGDINRLRRFELHFAGTYYAEEARFLRDALETRAERERASHENQNQCAGEPSPREATAEQKRGQAEQQQAEEESRRSQSKENGQLGKRAPRSQSRPARLAFRSWTYFKMAVTTVSIALAASYLDQIPDLRGLPLGGVSVLIPHRVLFAATVALLVALLTESQKINRIAVLFAGVYAIGFISGFTEIQAKGIPGVYLVVNLIGSLLRWLFVVYAASIRIDRKFLVIVAILAVADGLLTEMGMFDVVSPPLHRYVIDLYYFCTGALLITYGIRKQTSQVPLGN